jgi:hypothetical protein
MDLAKKYNPNIFSLKTKKHGIVDFSHLAVWRMTLIIETTKKMQDIEPSEFCLIVAKYLISRKDNILFDEEYYKKIKSHNNIKLLLDKEELDNFSKEFVKAYKDLISDYVEKDEIDKLDNYQLIKIYFIKSNEDFDKLVKKTTGFTNLPYDKNLFDQVKKVSEVMKNAFPRNLPDELNRITEATKVFAGKTPDELARLSKTIKKAVDMNPFNNLSKNNEEGNQQIYPPPIIHRNYELEALTEINENFKSLLTTLNTYNEYSKDMLKVTNTIINNIKDKLEFQIKTNEKTSKTAFIVSIIALILSAFVFFAQILISNNSNKYIDKLNLNIDKLNNTYNNLNTTNVNSSQNIDSLIDELILQDKTLNQNDVKLED